MDGEKVTQIISLFNEGKPLEEVAQIIGYAQSSSVSRFMNRYDYKWSKKTQNYVYAGKKESAIFQNSNFKETENKHETDALDLLENEDVIELLSQAKRILSLVNNQKLTIDTTENLWKKAQKYIKSNEPSVNKSFRFSLEIENKINKFSKSTNLSQKQILCVALEEFFEKNQMFL
jgi:hypothetical protein